jgi:hypothetical protein
MRSTLALLIPLALLLLGLPLLGVTLSGRAVSGYLTFPPTPGAARHAPFYWPAFLALASLILAVLLPFVQRVIAFRGHCLREAAGRGRLPWWGWLGAACLAAAWFLAWTRIPWFAALQPYTFSPIWFSYVVLVNAQTYRRSGCCMLTGRPCHLLALFPLSAVFWWFFEFLNRFVGNWHYVGVPDIGAGAYFWQATLAFSTVLPAVLGTCELLATYPRLSAGLERAWCVRIAAPRRVAGVSLALGCVVLACIGIWPRILFPVLWVAPLVVLVALQRLRGEPTVLAPLAKGDWSELWRAALAALLCGGLWEMWNAGSLAHWEYSVPYVHRFEIFHMPLLGYAGYLPFGLQCLAVARLLPRPSAAPDTR